MHRPEAIEQRGQPRRRWQQWAGAHLRNLDIAHPMMTLLEAHTCWLSFRPVMCRPPHCHLLDLPVESSPQKTMALLLVLSKAMLLLDAKVAFLQRIYLVSKS